MFQDLCILNICFSKLIVTLHLDDLYDLDEERFSSTSSRWKHVIYIVQTPVLCTIILMSYITAKNCVCKYTQSRRSRVVHMKQIHQWSEAEWCICTYTTKRSWVVYVQHTPRSEAEWCMLCIHIVCKQWCKAITHRLRPAAATCTTQPSTENELHHLHDHPHLQQA